MKIFGFTYVFGNPETREKLKAAEPYIVCALIAIAAMGASWIVGYLWGLTCFYYG